MTPKSITVYYESKVKGKEQFTSRTFGGSITVELAEWEDVKQAYERAWNTVRSQVMKQMVLYSGENSVDANEKVDPELGF